MVKMSVNQRYDAARFIDGLIARTVKEGTLVFTPKPAGMPPARIVNWVNSQTRHSLVEAREKDGKVLLARLQ